MTTFGQVRSCRTMGTHGEYLSNGIFFGVTGCGGIGVSFVALGRDRVVGWVSDGRKMKNPPAVQAGGAGERGYVTLALHKKEEVAAGHGNQSADWQGRCQLTTVPGT